MSYYRKKMFRTSDKDKIIIRKSALWTFFNCSIVFIVLFNIQTTLTSAATVAMPTNLQITVEPFQGLEKLPLLNDIINQNNRGIPPEIQFDDTIHEHKLSTDDNRYLLLSGKNFLMLTNASDSEPRSAEHEDRVEKENAFRITPTFSRDKCDDLGDSESFEYIVNSDNEIIILLKKFNFNNHKYSHAYLCVTNYAVADAQDNEIDGEFPMDEVENRQEMRHLGEGSIFYSQKSRGKREVSNEITANSQSPQQLRIEGFRIEHADKLPTLSSGGIPEITSNTNVVLRLFGTGITKDLSILFTQEANVYGGSCQISATHVFKVIADSVTENSALVEILIPKGDSTNSFYFCAKLSDTNEQLDASHTIPFTHQGSDSWLQIYCFDLMIPIWASIIIIVICLMFSALFSGLNLGLMSLDRTDLKILCNTGTENEKKYARAIQPVRDHGNFLLCSILLGNVLVNSTFTILLDSLTSGFIAIIFSTIAIVIFGEITPQALCSRHGLAVGAKTIYITKAVMIITFPLSYPTSKILDFLLGEEIGNFYNRDRLKELVKVTTDVNELDKNEVNIISGVLELRKKSVGDIMTHLDDAFMLSIETILDFETVSEIMKSGFSRIPVYENVRNNIITLLYIKDLAFIDTDDNTPLRTLCQFYQNPCHFVFDDVTLDVMFNQFKEGHKGHMAFVHRVNNEGDGDPFYETIGLVTLEDVIEELIQSEIVDETDVFTDNRKKVRRTRLQKQDFTIFAEKREQKIQVSPQLILATFQYLSAAVDLFKPENISPGVLRRLLNEDVVQLIKSKGKEKNDPSFFIYNQGKPADFFVLILEGRVEVTIGRENLTFESGPFTYFGTQALAQNVAIDLSPQQFKGSIQSLNMDLNLRHTFIPDYSIKAIGDVIYVSISRQLYLAAKKATLMQRMHKYDTGSEPLDVDVEKLLHSLEEDEQSLGNNGGNMNSPRDGKPINARAPTDVAQNGPTQISPTYSAILFSQGGSRKNSVIFQAGPSQGNQNTNSNSNANPNQNVRETQSQSSSANANAVNANPANSNDDSNAPLLPKPKS